MATDQMYRDIFYYICGKDNSSEYFEGIWIDRTTCTWDNAIVSLLRPVSCQREIGTEFMCRVIDVELVSGTLPTDVSFSETRKSTIGDTECFHVNGFASLTANIYYFNQQKGIIIAEYCSKSILDMDILCSKTINTV